MKEWRRLRDVRWLGCLLGVGLPLLAMAGNEAARRGIVSMGEPLGLQDLALAIPEIASTLLWPLMALLIGVQSFAAGSARADGFAVASIEGAGGRLIGDNAPFKERAQIWTLRLAASIASLLTVILFTLAAWLGLAVLGEAPERVLGGEAAAAATADLLGGVAFAAVSLLAGAAATAFTRRPFLALLLGLALAILPIGLASAAALVFPYAIRWGRPAGEIAVWILPAGYAAASFTGFTPVRAGGGPRVVRSLLSLVAALIVFCFAFGMLARARPRPGPDDVARLRIDPSPAGGAAILSGAGDTPIWLADVDRARIVASLPPPNWSRAWKADGSMFAIQTCSGPLGSLARARVGLFGRDGKPAARSWIAPDPRAILHGLWWSGHRVVIRSRESSGIDRLYVVEPESGITLVAEVPPSGWRWEVAGPDHEGGLIVAVERDRRPPRHGARNEPKERDVHPGRLDEPAHGHGADSALHELRRLDLGTGRLDAHPLYEEGGPIDAPQRLSPSGRYWLRASKAPGGSVVDLMTGAHTGAGAGAWLSDDSLVRIERDGADRVLVLEKLGEIPRAVRRWSGKVSISISPDRRRLLVRTGASSSESAPEWVYEPEVDLWIELPIWTGPRLWAGPRTLARLSPGLLDLEDLDSPGKLRSMIGTRSSR